MLQVFTNLKYIFCFGAGVTVVKNLQNVQGRFWLTEKVFRRWAAIATIVIFCTLALSSEGAVIIKMANNEEPSSASEDLRTVTILQSDDRTPNKRDSPLVLLSEQEPVQRRSTFTVNEKRPCTLCKFYTTEKPTPKQRMYYKFVNV
ncbi:hypothetical protein pipiens_016376 [Culex pipiens pipiens]|uniref:Uncharacterized protein n=1 Tax=Culex pipiens pipiens TaxID=38569 RepID=A0ABD1CLJ0_CULPP